MQLLPITLMAVTNIREVKGAGVFFPIKQAHPTLLLTGEPGAMHAIKLDGDDAFNQFPISLRTPADGLFISNIEVRADLESRLAAGPVSDQRGTLILAGEELSVVVGNVGNNMADPAPFPLSFTINEGADSAPIAFKAWALGVRQDDRFVPLWQTSQTDR